MRPPLPPPSGGGGEGLIYSPYMLKEGPGSSMAIHSYGRGEGEGGDIAITRMDIQAGLAGTKSRIGVNTRPAPS
jgi:hypothetical protein